MTNSDPGLEPNTVGISPLSRTDVFEPDQARNGKVP
jgi:hypothetical protein